jgi:hypothetical protein
MNSLIKITQALFSLFEALHSLNKEKIGRGGSSLSLSLSLTLPAWD